MKENKLFNKVIMELRSFCFNTTNLIDDLSTDENEQEKEMVESAIMNMLQSAKFFALKNEIIYKQNNKLKK